MCFLCELTIIHVYIGTIPAKQHGTFGPTHLLKSKCPLTEHPVAVFANKAMYTKVLTLYVENFPLNSGVLVLGIAHKILAKR